MKQRRPRCWSISGIPLLDGSSVTILPPLRRGGMSAYQGRQQPMVFKHANVEEASIALITDNVLVATREGVTSDEKREQ